MTDRPAEDFPLMTDTAARTESDSDERKERQNISLSTRRAESLVFGPPIDAPPELPEDEDEHDAPPMLPRAFYPLGWTHQNVRRGVALFFAGFAACWFLWQIQDILPPFLLSFFLAALLDPTLRAMEQHGRSRLRGIFTIYAAAFSVVALLVLFAVRPAVEQIQEITVNFSDNYARIQHSANVYIQQHSSMVHLLGIKQERLQDIISQSPVRDKISASLTALTIFVSSFASRAIWLIIIPVATFFLMRDYPMLRARAIALFPETYHDHIDRVSREIVDVFSAYLRGLAKICLLYSLTAIALFWLLGVKYALFLGLLAGAFYAVPYVGQFVTACGSGAVAYLMESHQALLFWHVPEHSIPYAVLVLLSAVLAQNLFDQLVYPRVVGQSVGLHPVVSIFALASGATLFGVWGLLLGVPIAASIQILLTFFFPKLTQKPPDHLLAEPPPLV